MAAFSPERTRSVSWNEAIGTPVGSLEVNYTYPNTTGTLTYTVPPDAYGTANITLTVMDSGGTANTVTETCPNISDVTMADE